MDESQRIYRGGASEYNSLRGERVDAPYTGRPTEPRKTTHLYKERWYVLLVYCVLAVLQGMDMTTYGPVQEHLQLSVGWTLLDFGAVHVLQWSTVALTAPLCICIILNQGLRFAVICASASLAIGNTLRCLANRGIAHMMFSAFGNIASGLLATVLLSGGPIIAQTWFNSAGIKFVNVVTIASPFLGMLLSFTIEPWIYDYVKASWIINGTEIKNGLDLNENILLMKILYVDAALSSIIFVVVLSYFPCKPDMPPEVITEYTDKTLRSDLWKLLRQPRTLLIFVPIGVSFGVFVAWVSCQTTLLTGVIDRVYFKEFGLCAIGSGILSAIIVSGIVSRVESKWHVIGFIMLTVALVSAICFSVFVTVDLNINRYVALHICNALIAVFLLGTAPLLVCRARQCLPATSWIILCALVPLSAATMSTIFYAVLFIPYHGGAAVPFMLIAVISLSLLALIAHKEEEGFQPLGTSVQDD